MRTAALLVVLGLASAAPAQEPQGQVQRAALPEDAGTPEMTLSVSGYREELERIEASLRTGDLEDARARARALALARVTFGEEVLATDRSVLDPVASVERTQAARQASRIAAVARALGESTGEAASATGADHERLEKLRRQQTLAPIEKGGEVSDLPLAAPSLSEQVRSVLKSIADWIGDVAGKIWDWLSKLWPEPKRSGSEESGLEVNLMVLALVATVTALLAVLAVRALRRSRAEPGELASAALARSSRDEDPLSREANEWERYAAELAAAGRRREAIRAWYHAVLVALFRAGTLHYQKGRTNWEYASRVPPESAWRPSFIEITRAFDREWYGRDTSTLETLRECAAEAKRILRAARGAEA